MEAVWLDVEGTLDRTWAQCIGADPEKYRVVLADYGEQYANIADNVLRADDCGLVVVDSLAAITPEAEMEKAAEDDFYALQARLIGRMVRKLKQQLIRQRKRGHPCSVILMNQMRSKIGVQFGSPETMAGGHALKHEFSLLMRCVKTALKDNEKKLYAGKEKDKAVRHAFSIRKEKVLTLGGTGYYMRLREDMPEVGLKKGQVADYGTVMTYAKEYGVVAKTSSKQNPWKYKDSISSRTLEKITELWKLRPLEYLWTQMEIVRRAKARLGG